MAEYTIDKIEYGDNVYKLQDNVSGYVSGGNVIPYLTCDTAAGTAAKTTTLVTGTLPTTLTTGTRVAVKFTNSNSIANPTITIGSYGAIAIKRYGTTAPSTSAVTSWNAGNVITLVYDGTYWMMADWTTTNSTYSEISETNITSGSGTSTGLVSGRRAKAAVNAFAPVKDVIVNGDSVVSEIGAAALITVPTKTSQLTNDSGFVTTDTNTTYTLTNALSSHKFTWTLTAGGSGSGSTTTTAELVAGTGITLTDDTTNKKITIASSIINTDEKLAVTEVTSETMYYPLLGTGTTASTRQYDTHGFSYSAYFNTTNGGQAELALGNDIAKGTANNQIGILTLYGSGSYAVSLMPSTLTNFRNIYLPDKTGTVALTSDIPTRGTATSGGTTLSLVNTGDMYTWDNKTQVQIIRW